ncbi:MAG: hypothetical protein HOQ45_03495, partial [Nocardioidaceae bacterium]|nr:hypothetical protein [Nocardioidaceae bacterium]
LGRAAASLPGEMRRNDVARGGRSERIADGNAAALWAAHRAHVADYGRARACSPVSHRDVHGLVTVLSRLWQHDVAVARRTQVAHGVLLFVLGVALIASTPPVAVALLGLAVVVLVVSPVLYARLRYVRLWRPSFV